LKQVDLEPRRHSSSYELKPMSRWWLVLAVALSILGIFGNGWANPATWYLLMCGWMLGFAAILTNPKRWLSKLRD
jgi:hypothetical protein